jgi:hypothetical protein
VTAVTVPVPKFEAVLITLTMSPTAYAPVFATANTTPEATAGVHEVVDVTK